MPCYTEPSQYEQSITEKYEEVINQLACAYCKHLEKTNHPIPENAKEWWRLHKIEDEIRHKKEKEEREQNALKTALKNKALSKLTEEDKKILGIK